MWREERHTWTFWSFEYILVCTVWTPARTFSCSILIILVNSLKTIFQKVDNVWLCELQSMSCPFKLSNLPVRVSPGRYLIRNFHVHSQGLSDVKPHNEFDKWTRTWVDLSPTNWCQYDTHRNLYA